MAVAVRLLPVLLTGLLLRVIRRWATDAHSPANAGVFTRAIFHLTLMSLFFSRYTNGRPANGASTSSGTENRTREYRFVHPDGNSYVLFFPDMNYTFSSVGFKRPFNNIHDMREYCRSLINDGWRQG